jgi:hypothetical protein
MKIKSSKTILVTLDVWLQIISMLHQSFFLHITKSIANHNIYFTQKHDACGVMGLFTILKIIIICK